MVTTTTAIVKHV